MKEKKYMSLFGWLSSANNKLDEKETDLRIRDGGVREREMILDAKENTQSLRDSELKTRESIQEDYQVGRVNKKIELSKLDAHIEYKKKLSELINGQHAEILKLTETKFTAIIAEKDKSLSEIRDILKVMAAKIPEINLNNISVIPTQPPVKKGE